MHIGIVHANCMTGMSFIMESFTVTAAASAGILKRYFNNFLLDSIAILLYRVHLYVLYKHLKLRGGIKDKRVHIVINPWVLCGFLEIIFVFIFISAERCPLLNADLSE